MAHRRLFLIGPPGSGKTTIGRMLADQLGWSYVSTGDLVRQMARSDPTVAEATRLGKLAPGSIDRILAAEVLKLLPAFDVGEAPARVIDGYPRYLEQLLDLAQLVGIGRQGQTFFASILLSDPRVAAERVRQRRQRDYDPIDTSARWSEFQTRTMPMVAWLRERSITVRYTEVDSTYETPGAVMGKLLDRLRDRGLL